MKGFLSNASLFVPCRSPLHFASQTVTSRAPSSFPMKTKFSRFRGSESHRESAHSRSTVRMTHVAALVFLEFTTLSSQRESQFERPHSPAPRSPVSISKYGLAL